MLNFCRDIFGRVAKQLDKKAKFNFKIYDVINWETNNWNTLYTYLKFKIYRLQYAHYPISQEVKEIEQLNLVI